MKVEMFSIQKSDMCLLFSDLEFLGILQGRFGRFTNLLLSAKLKARHVQVRALLSKTESPGVANIETDDQKYSQTGSEFRESNIIKWLRNVTGLDCTLKSKKGCFLL